MGFLGFIAAAIGALMSYGGFTGRDPLAILSALANNKEIPKANTWHAVMTKQLDIITPPSGGDIGGIIGGPILIGTPPGSGSAGNGGRLAVVQAALSQQGKPYVWDTPVNASDPNPKSFDCSGLTMWAYEKVGIHLPHHAASQELMGTSVSLANAQPGDLIFWGAVSSHVVMYLGNNQCVQAPHTGDVVKISALWDTANIRVRSYLAASSGGSNPPIVKV